MKNLTIDEIKQKGWLIYEVIAGSKSYGLDTADSDTDIRGIFILPEDVFYSLEYTPQVSNATNDIIYYELRRFMELLSVANPNIIEMLNVPDDCVLFADELMSRVTKEIFLSKLCENTFANYAFTQVKKARGLEKKIMNPMEKEMKTVLDFCFVYTGQKAVAVKDFLSGRGGKNQNAGLTAIDYMKDCYNLFYSDAQVYSGIVKADNANDVCLSHIPKGEIPVGILYFNKDGYSVYCKQYKQYWEWVEKRNEKRYLNTINNGKNYDAKNMMHVFRLLLMAKEIAAEGRVNVYRQDRDFLLSIKEGKYDYTELLTMAEEIKNELPQLYEVSMLKEIPDRNKINEALINMREAYYLRKK